MTDGFIMIILAMIGCIGLGVLLGWSFWGSDAKYYKNLAETYKEKPTSQDVDVKEVILRYLKNREIEIKRDKNVVNKICKQHEPQN